MINAKSTECDFAEHMRPKLMKARPDRGWRLLKWLVEVLSFKSNGYVSPPNPNGVFPVGECRTQKAAPE